MEIAGKTVLITGGAVRIGQALSQAFAAAGARVIVHCNRSREAAFALTAALPAVSHGSHQVVSADFALPDAATAFFAGLPGPIDILVNNASVFIRRAFDTETPADAALQMRINCTVPVELMRLFAAQPGLTEGAIINFLDQQIVRYPVDAGSYLLSKQALADATLLAARRLAPKIRVNGIAPGPVLPPVGHNGPGFQKVLADVPLGRPVALDDICQSCLFLIRTPSITGQILFVDGGQHLS